MGSENGQRTRVAAIYARVSSERQRQAETIQSQLAALRELAGGRGLWVPDDLVFEDEGFSGATLIRPALERLRDRAAEGAFEVLLCHAPDRLARRYAYQVLLLEELARAGVEVVFAKEPERSGSPEDELLRQFQGMISEYERAQIAERTRRGTLHRARAGAVAVLSRAPYGYRYIRKSEHADAFLEINETEARVVREIFDRYAHKGESVGAIARWVSERGVPTRTGAAVWSQSTIWGMLRNPAYAGQAAYGKTRMTEGRARLTRTTRQRGERHGGQACERVGSEQWIHIPVPALINEETFALAQKQLTEGKRLSPRNTRRPSLLQGILVCAGCGYAYYRSQTTTRQGRVIPLLPLLRDRRLASPAWTGVRQPAGTPGGARRARLVRGAAAARRSRADPGRDLPSAREPARGAPRQPPPRGAGARPRASTPRRRAPDRGIPGRADLAR